MPPNTSLTLLLRACEQLHECTDEELQNQILALAPTTTGPLVSNVRMLLHTSLYLRQQLDPDGIIVASSGLVDAPLMLLSAREQEVLVLLRKGYTMPCIADKLCISVATVNNHCAKMREKLGLRGRNALVLFAGGIKK